MFILFEVIIYFWSLFFYFESRISQSWKTLNTEICNILMNSEQILGKEAEQVLQQSNVSSWSDTINH